MAPFASLVLHPWLGMNMDRYAHFYMIIMKVKVIFRIQACASLWLVHSIYRSVML